MLIDENDSTEQLTSKLDKKLSFDEVDVQESRKPKTGPLIQTDPYLSSYICLVVPRFEEHLLTGDLSESLYSWMKDICISFGWQLKFIDIKPKYLHWIIAVSIHTYPTKFMKIIMRESSKRIFEDFPRFKQKNMSNDFWAPWFFAGLGEVPYSQATLQSLIDQIRIDQGLH